MEDHLVIKERFFQGNKKNTSRRKLTVSQFTSFFHLPKKFWEKTRKLDKLFILFGPWKTMCMKLLFYPTLPIRKVKHIIFQRELNLGHSFPTGRAAIVRTTSRKAKHVPLSTHVYDDDQHRSGRRRRRRRRRREKKLLENSRKKMLLLLLLHREKEFPWRTYVRSWVCLSCLPDRPAIILSIYLSIYLYIWVGLGEKAS